MANFKSPNTSSNRSSQPFAPQRHSERDRPKGLSERPHRGQPAEVAQGILAVDCTCYWVYLRRHHVEESEHKQVHDRGTGRDAGGETHLVISSRGRASSINGGSMTVALRYCWPTPY